MFVHEYDSTEYETFEECSEALDEWIETEDIIPHLEFDMEGLLSKFFRRRSDEEFCSWLFNQIEEATTRAKDELITEYEEGEVE